MNALYLSGESLYNKTWIESVAKEFEPLFDKTVIHQYRHWNQGGPINIEYELPLVIEEVDKLSPYVIVAKSAGSVLSMLGVARGALDPELCVFVGIPLPLAKLTDNSLATWAHNYHKPSLIIQNDHDPLTSAHELQAYINGINLHDNTFVTLPGDSHNYTDLTKLHELVATALH